MKKSLLAMAMPAMAFAAITLAACNNDAPEEHEHDGNTHVHEDGTVHEHHDEVTQEEFHADSTHMHTDSTMHEHNGVPHKH